MTFYTAKTATAGANLFKPRHDPYVGGNAHSDRGLRGSDMVVAPLGIWV
ncbi:hypothetical protein MTIV3_ORF2 [Metallosphaera turreted icosahedral virus 3]|nr:hypothetical protein MTIV3_ORF2 [Metallosphaera turreted icosahedral virus 3]